MVKVSDPGGFKWRLVIAYDGTKFAGSSLTTDKIVSVELHHRLHVILVGRNFVTFLEISLESV